MASNFHRILPSVAGRTGLQKDSHVTDMNLNRDSRPGETQWTTRMMPTRAEKSKWMPGDRVKVLKGSAAGCYGVVKTTYVSKDIHKKHWVGIDLDEPFGRHDGMAEVQTQYLTQLLEIILFASPALMFLPNLSIYVSLV